MGRRAAAVKVDSGPIEATDPLHYVPKDRWRDLMLARRQFLDVKVSHDCRCLVEFVDDAKQMFKTLGFSSVEDMIRDGYGLEPEEVAIAVRWLELNPPDDPVPMETAVKLGRHGGPRYAECTDDQGSDITTLMGRGSEYIKARLRRDDPSLAAQVDAGKLSADAAAKQKGWRKPRPKLSKFEQIVKWLPGLTDKQRQQLRDLL